MGPWAVVGSARPLHLDRSTGRAAAGHAPERSGRAPQCLLADILLAGNDQDRDVITRLIPLSRICRACFSGIPRLSGSLLHTLAYQRVKQLAATLYSCAATRIHNRD